MSGSSVRTEPNEDSGLDFCDWDLNLTGIQLLLNRELGLRAMWLDSGLLIPIPFPPYSRFWQDTLDPGVEQESTDGSGNTLHREVAPKPVWLSG